MATEKVKGISMEISKVEATILVNALEVVIAQVNRSKVKELNPEVVKLRDAQVVELRNLSNKIAYGSKEIV